jgi:hypothetical protein
MSSFLLHYRDFEIVIALITFEQGTKMTFAMTLDLVGMYFVGALHTGLHQFSPR